MREIKVITAATEPKSLCQCGHTGDGPGSQHTGQIGHGECVFCKKCKKFSWAAFTDYGRGVMDGVKWAMKINKEK